MSPSNGDSVFGFNVTLSLAVCMSLICTWGRWSKLNLVLLSLSLSESLKKFFDNFFTSVKLILKLLENRIYGIETVKVNRKFMPCLRADKQMKHGEHGAMA